MDRRRALTRGGTLAALALLALYVLLGGELDFPGGGATTATAPTVASPEPQTETDAGTESETSPAPAPAGNGQVSEQEAAGISATLARIDSGEPLPYDQDGTSFQNREGLLPPQREGYYSEYAVVTPGSDDRGARRLVIGESGETYYTSDHYDSFIQIDPEEFR